MRKLLALLATMAALPATAQDTAVSTDQVTQRLISRSGGSVSGIVQEGGGNSAGTIQAGGGNRAAIHQSGFGNISVIRQAGIGHDAETKQTGGAGVVVTQTGRAGSIQIQQFAPGAGHVR